MAVRFAKDPDAGYPDFKTMDEYIPVQSTKMTTTARICKHYLQDGHVDSVKFDNEAGVPRFPPVEPAEPGEKPPKILIYTEFLSLTPLLQKVLRLYGVESLAIDGSMSFKKRDKIVAQFRKSTTI
ncbi:hypothetical protein D9758_016218 [Tetrapyrgos nigripes]|uniref:Uncharacterized protein n=1 Tax=Tetrapyrgos nigripes TaxID=182062 RepID=A0A8H5CNC7_9AGAR|nr:hypothetical protein D9758_016218 [Tetrapyrgos nigripes]